MYNIDLPSILVGKGYLMNRNKLGQNDNQDKMWICFLVFRTYKLQFSSPQNIHVMLMQIYSTRVNIILNQSHAVHLKRQFMQNSTMLLVSTKKSGIFFKNIQDPRSLDPAFYTFWTGEFINVMFETLRKTLKNWNLSDMDLRTIKVKIRYISMFL